MEKPLLAVTLGDPAGIGPHAAVQTALDGRVRARCRPLLLGDAWIVQRFCSAPGLRVRPVMDPAEYRPISGGVNVLHVPHPRIRSIVPGRPQRTGGESAALSVRAAVALALSRRVAAIVTGPASKESFHMAGLPFPGHTELLAALCGTGAADMLMTAGRLKALLVTRHLPLKDVPRALSRAVLSSAIARTDAWLRRHGFPRPRWALAGLNPHAGDNGLLGTEEKTVVAPAAAALRARGLRMEGPLPADVAWARHVKGEFDVVACLYHDQGMIPLKALHPGQVVNVTTGLPFVRTSPGHGTAFDLAGKKFRGADPSATIAAAHAALDLAEAAA